ncbi:MAG: hypothetical protein RLZZ271_1028, partial [Pseudomonadota bacterium]
NKAGGLIMSVAVEEMLHMSLSGNLYRALGRVTDPDGGLPNLNLYRLPSTQYPTPLPHHNPKNNPVGKGEFKVPLAALSVGQLDFFLGIEWPEKPTGKPQGNNWDTIGQFYDYLKATIIDKCADDDFQNVEYQLGNHKGYYTPNNVDTIYPKNANYTDKPVNWNDPASRGAKAAVYPNNRDTGPLHAIHSLKSAVTAINTVTHQGEGYARKGQTQYADKSELEETHYFKFKMVQDELRGFTAEEQATFIHPFPANPTLSKYAHSAQYDYRPFVQLANAVFTYIFQMTQASYGLTGAAQHMMFNIGMHKGMIFVLDKIINAMRYYHVNGDGVSGSGSGEALAPSFENYPFRSLATAKQEMLELFQKSPLDFQQNNANIIQRLSDLPDINVGADGIIRF